MSYSCAFCDDEFSDNVMCPECVAALLARAEKAERERDEARVALVMAEANDERRDLKAAVSRLTAERDALKAELARLADAHPHCAAFDDQPGPCTCARGVS